VTQDTKGIEKGGLMGNENMNKAKISGRGEKARNNVDAARSDIKALYKVLGGIVKAYEFFNMIEGKKRRSMVDVVPARIDLNENGLWFYIEFTLQATTSGEEQDIQGVIIYGTSRTLCFRNWPFGEKLEDEIAQKMVDPMCCHRITRCDGLEDKPLLRLTVNRHGRIRSAEIDDEWWIVPLGMDDTEEEKLAKTSKNQDTLADLHFRAIDRIWGDAVDWTNENLLP
jgi:hypothetical protein